MSELLQPVYKVVWRVEEDGKLKYISANPTKGYTVEYLPGVAVYPFPDTFLFAFLTIDAALDYWKIMKKPYLAGMQELQIWKAEADVVNVAVPSAGFDRFDLFWKENLYSLDLRSPWVSPCHKGSVWCYSLRLQEKVHP